jgi:hypothetical protein
MPPEPIGTDPELNAIAAALEALAPARSRIDRDRLMFQAGQARALRGQRGRSPLIVLTALLGLTTLGEAALLARRPAPRVAEARVANEKPLPVAIVASRPAAPRAAPPSMSARSLGSSFALGQTAHERLAGQVLRYGLDALPAALPIGSIDDAPQPIPSRQLLLEEVRRVLDPGDAS